MGCQFHSLIEDLENNDVLVHKNVSDREYVKIMSMCHPHLKNFICFDMGNVRESLIYRVHVPIIFELVKAPFKFTWFEERFRGQDGSIGICGTMVMFLESVMMVNFVKFSGEWTFRFMCSMPELKSQKFDVIIPKLEDTGIEVASCYYNIATFLTALGCRNVNKIEVRPDKKLQLSRRKKGKKPIFSHWVLEIGLPREATETASKGGTHSSPRVHLRRGHPRQYKLGHYTWVQECVVGSVKGIVSKSYASKYGDESEND